MSLDFSHWIRGYLYDSDGNPISGATVTASNVSGSETGTETTTTTASGYYQLNVQDICNEEDLIKIQFNNSGDLIEEFIRVLVDDLTQEVNATFENQFKITTDSFTFYLPEIRWNSADGKVNKDIQLFNFKIGEISTTDRDIESEPYSISGWIYVDYSYTRDTISGKVEAIVHLQNNSEEITIHNVNNTIDGTYVIKKFTFKPIEGYYNLFEWRLILEESGD